MRSMELNYLKETKYNLTADKIRNFIGNGVNIVNKMNS